MTMSGIVGISQENAVSISSLFHIFLYEAKSSYFSFHVLLTTQVVPTCPQV